MNLDKKTMAKIVLLMFAAAIIFIGMQNVTSVLDAVGFVVGLFGPFIVGLCIAFILNIPMRLFEVRIFGRFGAKRPGSRTARFWNTIRRPLSMVIAFIIVGAIIALIVLMIVPEIGNTFKLLSVSIPSYAQQLIDWLDELLIRYGIVDESIFEIEINWNYISDALIGFFTSGTTATIVDTTYNVTASIFGGVFDFVLSLVFSIYVLATKERLSRQCVQVLEAFLPDRFSAFILKVAKLSYGIFANFVTGQMLEAIILGSLCLIGMTIFGMPYAMMISVMVGVTALIPVVGAFIGAGVGAFLIFIVEPITALWFLLYVIILQQLEGNIIYPRVVGKSVGLSGMWVLLAVLVGSSVGGMVGMLIAVPTCSVIYTLMREFIMYMLVKRGKMKPEDADPDEPMPPPKPLREVYKELWNKATGKKKAK